MKPGEIPLIRSSDKKKNCKSWWFVNSQNSNHCFKPISMLTASIAKNKNAHIIDLNYFMSIFLNTVTLTWT